MRKKGKEMSKKKELLLEGLCCANCGNKIEAEIKNLEPISHVSLNFISKKLSFEIKEEKSLPAILKEISKIVKRIEPEVEIKEYQPLTEQQALFNKKDLIRLVVGTVFFVAALFTKEASSFYLYLISYLVIGGNVLWKASKNIFNREIFDENFLMAVATLGAFAIHQYPEGVAVMLFYQVGELLQNMAVNNSRRSITSLLNIRPDYANLLQNGEIKQVAPQDVQIGDLILVKPGEKIPLDGQVLKGTSLADTSTLTGEPLPKELEEGSYVYGGWINKTGVLTVKVEQIFSQSTVTKILDLVENASTKKANTENFITKFARYYTPFIVFSALVVALIPPLLLQNGSFSQWFYRALVFLVISCPCALVISIPLSFFGGIGGASKNGILIKGSNYLEALNSVDTVIFDKTGTLTKGIFQVVSLHPAPSFSEHELLEYAAYSEAYSNHPIALSIREAYGQEIAKEAINNYEEITGKGIHIDWKGKSILAGNAKLMDSFSICFTLPEEQNTVVHLAIDNQYAGYLVLADQIKDDAKETLSKLREMGIKKLIILTGDNCIAANQIGQKLGVEDIYAELLPHEKLERMEQITLQKIDAGKTIFVGDGINDAPVLARADIGVAMGALGSDAAIEAADIILMNDKPSKLITALQIAQKTRSIVWQNIIFTLTVKLLVLILGIGGIASMWEAVFADVGVALIAIINAMRIIHYDYN